MIQCTFGCELSFVCRNLQQKLVDPIWRTLRDCNCFAVVVSPCFEQAEHKGQMQGEAKALQVPFYYIDRVFPQAFLHVANVRRVQVDAGYRIIGEGAWRNCQRLQIVHLDSIAKSPVLIFQLPRDSARSSCTTKSPVLSF